MRDSADWHCLFCMENFAVIFHTKKQAGLQYAQLTELAGVHWINGISSQTQNIIYHEYI